MIIQTLRTGEKLFTKIEVVAVILGVKILKIQKKWLSVGKWQTRYKLTLN